MVNDYRQRPVTRPDSRVKSGWMGATCGRALVGYQAARRHNGVSRLHAHFDGDVESVRVGTNVQPGAFLLPTKCPLVSIGPAGEAFGAPEL